jgi:hypothetical protein
MIFVSYSHRDDKWGCPRIAQQIALAFHIQIDKDVVRVGVHIFANGVTVGAYSFSRK